MGWWAGWAPGQRPAAELRRQSIGKVSSENQLSNFLMVSTEFGILNRIAFCTQDISEMPRTDQLADAFISFDSVFQQANI